MEFNESRFLSRAEAADYIIGLGLSVTKKSLAKFATIGGGPEFHKWGQKAVYTRDALDAWVASKLSPPMKSTSEMAPQKAGKQFATISDQEGD